MTNSSYTSDVSFGEEVNPVSVEMSEQGVNRVTEIFNRQVVDGMHHGSQLVVLRRGQVVIDRVAGMANVERKMAVTPETPFLTFSVSKAFTGMCVHRLIEQGLVDWDTPIVHYWPEWGCNGKEKATIRHAFLHQAGIPMRGVKTELLLLSLNWSLLMVYVARLKAEFEPGTRCAYHLVNYGYILGGVISCVTGMRPDQYLKKSFLDPLKMNNSYLGLPRHEVGRSARIYWGTKTHQLAVTVFNFPYVRGGIIPAATLNSTARDITRFYQMLINGGVYAGQRLVQTKTIQAATSLGYEGYDETLKYPLRWAYGFSLGGKLTNDPDEQIGMGSRSTVRTFGHFGMASSMAWADPDAELVVAFTCNRLIDDKKANFRWQELSDAIWDAIK